MSVLIEELKKEHAEIVSILNEVKELGVLSKEGQTRLLSAKAILLAHLKKEDEQLYPVLRKEAEINKQMKNGLDLCTIEMENVSRVVLKFFDKYSRGVSGKELQREFESLSVALDARIRNEEDILYEEHEWMNK